VTIHVVIYLFNSQLITKQSYWLNSGLFNYLTDDYSQDSRRLPKSMKRVFKLQKTFNDSTGQRKMIKE